MIRVVKGIGVGLYNANITELTIGNVIRRVLHLIREEHNTAINALQINNNIVNSNNLIKLDLLHKSSSSSSSTVFQLNSSNIMRQFSGDNSMITSDTNKGLLPEMRQNLLASINEYIDEVNYNYIYLYLYIFNL